MVGHDRDTMKHMFRLKLLVVLVLQASVIGLGVLLWQTGHQPVGPTDFEKLDQLADQVIAACASESYPPACYDEEIPKLMDEISMEDAFRVTQHVQAKDPDYWYCHVLGHNVSAREVAKDPANWKDVLRRCPTGVCSNGCLHGGLQERFREDVLSDEQIEVVKKDLDVLCEPREGFNPTGLEQASCYHAIGHLTMYIANADVPKAIEICDEVAVKDDGRNYLQTCYEGVFMQIFQPLEPEDFALVEDLTPEKEDLWEFCFSYPGEQAHACWREGWPLYWEELNTPEGLVEYCTYSSDERQQQRCFNAMFYILTAQRGFYLDQLVDICAPLPDQVRAQCFANAASRSVETDYKLASLAVALCEEADQYGVGDRCYQELLFYSRFNYHVGSEGFVALCQALPEPHQSMCLNTEHDANFFLTPPEN